MTHRNQTPKGAALDQALAAAEDDPTSHVLQVVRRHIQPTAAFAQQLEVQLEQLARAATRSPIDAPVAAPCLARAATGADRAGYAADRRARRVAAGQAARVCRRPGGAATGRDGASGAESDVPLPL